jgi:hypothetical protein
MDDQTIDSILENFELDNAPSWDKKTHQALTFWIPVEHKEKYDQIQFRSKKRFGKLLKEVLKKSIERFDLEAS